MTGAPPSGKPEEGVSVALGVATVYSMTWEASTSSVSAFRTETLTSVLSSSGVVRGMSPPTTSPASYSTDRTSSRPSTLIET